ncbi:unnamed protein product [Spirodela intermedia]|uniref:Uncharacterized protein n=1 Tax=Spirodela intermedia TaxID=51605 RepID=A0A7I8IU94_SPIIN|nr:unnamed protein product [Spirodela intermedia]CAA6661447.1 unnamed protein product [Spirodela intermedia]
MFLFVFLDPQHPEENTILLHFLFCSCYGYKKEMFPFYT